jgi:hypothetical protein
MQRDPFSPAALFLKSETSLAQRVHNRLALFT